MHVLILGGTTEASALAQLLADAPLSATLSLAGRTQNPTLPPIDCRIGGFGGAEGLAAWMREHRVTALIDATHPFASRMPFHAAQAAISTGIPLLSLLRPAWQRQSKDQWLEVEDHAAAITALGAEPRRVFLTVGRMELAAYATEPQHFYVIRSIDPVAPRPLPHAVWLTGRGPFTVESEQALMAEHRIEYLISKNSGGSATEAKLIAARMLRLPVILIRRPPRPDAKHVATAEEAIQWILCIHGLSS
ncbi:MAG: cobalt-precorrin-6A reductase [Pseudomonadota bacterium]|nr:cobalt-precorrin-6A reductase [Pseudomonadota bacterium]